MQLSIQQDEIEEALKEHIARMGVTGKVTDITFQVSRAPQRVRAEVEIRSLADPTPSSQVDPTERKEIPARKFHDLVADGTESDEETSFGPEEEQEDTTSEEESEAPRSNDVSLFG